jgi:hypothetical protein
MSMLSTLASGVLTGFGDIRGMRASTQRFLCPLLSYLLVHRQRVAQALALQATHLVA